MTITFTFAVFCQSDSKDDCGGEGRLDKFMDAIKNDNLLAPFKAEPNPNDLKPHFKLVEFDVYASENRGLGDLSGVGYKRPIFVGMVEGTNVAKEDITQPNSDAMQAFGNFLKEIFTRDIEIVPGFPEPYLVFPDPPVLGQKRAFSWVTFLVPDGYKFRESVGPGHGN